MNDLIQIEQPKRPRTDWAFVRERLSNVRGAKYWRTMEELVDTPEFRDAIKQEFPAFTDMLDSASRRNFLKLASVAMAMAGITACTKQPTEYIVPYVREPEEFVLGKPMFFATAMEMGGYATGLLVESHLNRPTKVEGNPDHPASLGATTIFEQAAILDIYDPDRSETVMRQGRIGTWSDFTGNFSSEAQNIGTRKGEGLAILTGTTTSPTLLDQMKTLTSNWPSAKWYVHEPSLHPAIASAARKIAGRNAFVSYDLSQADIIVSLESDFMVEGPAALPYARQFSARRRAIDSGKDPCRFYAVESIPTPSGSIAFSCISHFAAPRRRWLRQHVRQNMLLEIRRTALGNSVKVPARP